jgi:hypothetical protein
MLIEKQLSMDIELKRIESLWSEWVKAKDNSYQFLMKYDEHQRFYGFYGYEKIDIVFKDYCAAKKAEELAHKEYREAKTARDNNLHNQSLRINSGQVNNSSKLVSFLYELMRDYLPPGQVEEIIRNSCHEGEPIY